MFEILIRGSYDFKNFKRYIVLTMLPCRYLGTGKYRHIWVSVVIWRRCDLYGLKWLRIPKAVLMNGHEWTDKLSPLFPLRRGSSHNGLPFCRPCRSRWRSRHAPRTFRPLCKASPCKAPDLKGCIGLKVMQKPYPMVMSSQSLSILG